MNPENQGNGLDSLSNIFVKRKRGRPRKDQSQAAVGVANILATRDQIQVHPEHAHVPPGFERTNGSQPREGNTVIHNNDVMVGQRVTGVIEAAFDAGYLLSVKVGNSDIGLRGVVFKPGHFMPISVENDVAPHIQMIRRSAVLSPDDQHTPVHGSYRRGRGRGRARSESRLAYTGNGSASNQLSLYTDNNPSPLFGNRGSVVPVVLQPSANPSNAETPSNVTQTNQTETTQIQKVSETDNSSLTKQVYETDGLTLKLPVVNEVGEGIQGSSSNEPVQDLNPPFPIKPFQVMWSGSLNDPTPVPQNFGDARAGKMTELLLAVQENLIDKQAADAHPSEFSQHHN